jgi:AraC-like DNA-binding protein
MQAILHTSPGSAHIVHAKNSHLLYDIDIILKTSVGDHPSFDMLASAFNMSGRTLRRQLATAGTSYQKLVDRFRCGYAIECLLDGSMTTDEIAESLGFSDVANFRHAFKKWSGLSPAAYQSQYQNSSAA